jgi:hypothetical protein
MTGTVMLSADRPVRHPLPVGARAALGPGTFFYRLGTIGPLALLAYVMTTGVFRGRFSVMRIFGQTSLLVYWVHVELVYGLLFKKLANRLSMTGATVAFILMTAAMLALSLWRIHRWRGWRPAWQGLRRRLGMAEPPGNLPSARPPL